MNLLLFVIRILLAGIFLISGVAKLFDLPGSQHAALEFGVPGRLARLVGILLPITEIALALALLCPTAAQWGAAGTIALLLTFIVVIAVSLRRGHRPECHCFGQLHSQPIGASTVGRNMVLALFAAAVFWHASTAAGSHWPRVVLSLDSGEMAIVSWNVFTTGTLLVVGWFVIHLSRQNGRLLLRLESLEAHLARVLPGFDNSPAVGLPPGTHAPEFTLPDLNGENQTLSTLLSSGKPVLLVFVEPRCGPCRTFLPDLPRWIADHGGVCTLVVMSSGSIRDNLTVMPTEGLRYVLLQGAREVTAMYEIHGTPGAVVVGPDGTIARYAAMGVDAIRQLLDEMVAMTHPEEAIFESLSGGLGSNGQKPTNREVIHATHSG